MIRRTSLIHLGRKIQNFPETAYASLMIGNEETTDRQLCKIKYDIIGGNINIHIDREMVFEVTKDGKGFVRFFADEIDDKYVFDLVLQSNPIEKGYTVTVTV